VGGVATVLALLAGCSSAAPTVAAAGSASPRTDVPGTTIFAAAIRRPAPDVSGPTLDGGVLRLRDVAGDRVVVVNVWASWCTSCRAESAVLAAAAHDTAGVRFVGVDEADRAPAARRFVAATGTDYPQVLDPDGTLLQRLSVLPSTAIPSTLVLDPHGRMAARVIGPVTRPGLTRLITTLQREG
jgi:thiol-disulfide isomerase/thioredoxin